MSMTEPTTEQPAKKAPAKKRHARPKRAAPPAAKPSEMEGITVTDCPMACGSTKCVISGVNVCAHPHKAGLQVSVQNEDSLRRFNQAKRMLGQRKLDLQGS